MNSKKVNAAARSYAKEQIGADRIKANKPAVQAITEIFKAGAKWGADHQSNKDDGHA